MPALIPGVFLFLSKEDSGDFCVADVLKGMQRF